MNCCEPMELSISAFLDGEADLHEQAELVDHLLDCADCRRFYAQARGFQQRLDALAPVPVPAPARWGIRHLRPQLTGAARGWLQAAAALLILALGLALGGRMADPRGLEPRLPSADEAIEVQLASDSGALNDREFLGLTLRLLRGDRRYHRQMLEILKLVEPSLDTREAGVGEYKLALERGGADDEDGPENAARAVY